MPDYVSIRSAQATDADALTEFAQRTYSEAFGPTFLPADLAAHLERCLTRAEVARFLTADIVLLAESGGRTIGYLQFGDAHAAVDLATNAQQLRRIYVDAPFQNRGVGTRLMDAAFAHPRLLAARQVLLEVWEHNIGAQRFYVRYGFHVIATRPFAVASGSDTSCELLMRRIQLPSTT
jgi:diamine N-acetyltransferase